jgi:hypothetical protein
VFVSNFDRPRIYIPNWTTTHRMGNSFLGYPLYLSKPIEFYLDFQCPSERARRDDAKHGMCDRPDGSTDTRPDLLQLFAATLHRT